MADRLSRRDFLKLAGVALGAVTAHEALRLIPDKEGNIPAASDMSTALMRAWRATENKESQLIERQILQETGTEKNDFYTPYLNVIKTGVEKFQNEHPDKRVKWYKSDQYLNDKDVIKYLAEPIKSGESSLVPEKFINKPLFEILWSSSKDKHLLVEVFRIFYNRLPNKTQDVINTANTKMVAIPGTRLYKEHYPKFGNVFNDKDIINYYESIKYDLNELSNPEFEDKPLSMSDLTSYFLDKNNGDLVASLGDTAGFLKYMLRFRSFSAENPDQVQIEWVQNHILDQVNESFSLNTISSPDLLSSEVSDYVSSIWGLVYHVPHIVDLLCYISPEVIRSAVLFECLTHDHVAAGYKIKVDTVTLDSLEDTLHFLEKFSKN